LFLLKAPSYTTNQEPVCSLHIYTSIYKAIKQLFVSEINYCCKAQDGVQLSPDWIRRDTVTDALELAQDRSFWRQIATAGCYGWSLRAMMMMMMMMMK